MTPAQWTKVKEIVAGALSLRPEEQEAWLRAHPDLSPDIEPEVRRLLGHAQEDSIFDRPVLDAEEAPTFSFQPGAILLDRFEIVRFLGAGGMGEVYSAHDRTLRETVALKTLRPAIAAQPEYVSRLAKEVHIARRLNHPHLCRLYDVHAAPDGTFFLSMELCEGPTLAAACDHAPFPSENALPILRQLASALDAAHEAGILHRDLKSANVILVPADEGAPRAVITDFGLSRDTTSSIEETVSLFGADAIVGTPSFMAPEQLKGQGATAATDVYAFGVIAFQMVTGKLPFDGETPLAIALRRLQSEAPAVRSFERSVPRSWDETLRATLSADASLRPPTAQAVVDGLEGTTRFRLPLNRRRLILAALPVVAAAGGGWAYWATRPPVYHPDAVQAFRLGSELARRRTGADLRLAIDQFEKATKIQPDYAEAWTGLADVMAAGFHYTFFPPEECRRRVREAADRALELDSSQGIAIGALAYMESTVASTWRNAEPRFLRAVELGQNEPFTLTRYASFLGRLGRYEAAITAARNAVRNDPGAFAPSHQLTQELFRAGRFDEYFSQVEALVTNHSTMPAARLALARAYDLRGEYDKALKECEEGERFKLKAHALCERALIEAHRGNLDAARRWARQAEAEAKKDPVEPLFLALIDTALGDYDRAVARLEKALAEGDSSVIAGPTHRYLEPLNRHRGFQLFCRKLGFTR